MLEPAGYVHAFTKRGYRIAHRCTRSRGQRPGLCIDDCPGFSAAQTNITSSMTPTLSRVFAVSRCAAKLLTIWQASSQFRSRSKSASPSGCSSSPCISATASLACVWQGLNARPKAFRLYPKKVQLPRFALFRPLASQFAFSACPLRLPQTRRTPLQAEFAQKLLPCLPICECRWAIRKLTAKLRVRTKRRREALRL